VDEAMSEDIKPAERPKAMMVELVGMKVGYYPVSSWSACPPRFRRK